MAQPQPGTGSTLATCVQVVERCEPIPAASGLPYLSRSPASWSCPDSKYTGFQLIEAPRILQKKFLIKVVGAALERGSILASHLTAPGLILGISKNFIAMVPRQDLLMALLPTMDRDLIMSTEPI